MNVIIKLRDAHKNTIASARTKMTCDKTGYTNKKTITFKPVKAIAISYCIVMLDHANFVLDGSLIAPLDLNKLVRAEIQPNNLFIDGDKYG